MNALPEKTEESTKDRKACPRQQGRRMVKTVLLVLALGLVAWPAWNWVAAPLLALPIFTYWQMVGIVALIGVITRIFSAADRHSSRFRARRPAAGHAWAACRHAAKTRQG